MNRAVRRRPRGRIVPPRQTNVVRAAWRRWAISVLLCSCIVGLLLIKPGAPAVRASGSLPPAPAAIAGSADLRGFRVPTPPPSDPFSHVPVYGDAPIGTPHHDGTWPPTDRGVPPPVPEPFVYPYQGDDVRDRTWFGPILADEFASSLEDLIDQYSAMGPQGPACAVEDLLSNRLPFRIMHDTIRSTIKRLIGSHDVHVEQKLPEPPRPIIQ